VPLLLFALLFNSSRELAQHPPNRRSHLGRFVPAPALSGPHPVKPIVLSAIPLTGIKNHASGELYPKWIKILRVAILSGLDMRCASSALPEQLLRTSPANGIAGANEQSWSDGVGVRQTADPTDRL
jgi:hypothetical protein